MKIQWSGLFEEPHSGIQFLAQGSFTAHENLAKDLGYEMSVEDWFETVYDRIEQMFSNRGIISHRIAITESEVENDDIH